MMNRHQMKISKVLPYCKRAEEGTVKVIETKCFGNLKMRNNLICDLGQQHINLRQE